jgi:hypothetical protein
MVVDGISNFNIQEVPTNFAGGGGGGVTATGTSWNWWNRWWWCW